MCLLMPKTKIFEFASNLHPEEKAHNTGQAQNLFTRILRIFTASEKILGFITMPGVRIGNHIKLPGENHVQSFETKENSFSNLD